MKKFYREEELVFEEIPSNCRFKDLSKQRFGMLTVLGFASIEGRKAFWYCKCDCGNIKKIVTWDFSSGRTSSCGCLQVKKVKIANTTHGHLSNGNRHKLYTGWNAMLQRCQKSNNKNYPNYGERGIKVCDRWLKFENFLEDMGERPKGMSIDRIDVNGNYEPGNCRWATAKEQNNNRRDNHLLTFNGKTQTMAQWAEEIGLKSATLWCRINDYGWSVEKALTYPLRSIKYGKK